MRFFGDAHAPRNALIRVRPLRLNISVFSPRPAGGETAAPAAAAPEFDEDGRLWVFRFPQSAPRRYAIDRNRIFDYRRRRKLPTEGERAMRRDVRNAADFYTEIRELQTHPDVQDLML